MLPPTAIDNCAHGIRGFCQRYGFRDKPALVRLRILDQCLVAESEMFVIAQPAELDITLTQPCFAQLNLAVDKVFITENEINFLAFPPVKGSVVIFGAGYGFQSLAQADWLRDAELYYWGDIDTHGFAILSQLRATFPQAISLLMDRHTLLEHRAHWVEEPQPETIDLQLFTRDECALYNDDSSGANIRRYYNLKGLIVFSKRQKKQLEKMYAKQIFADDALNLEALEGFLFGLAMTPVAILPSVWMPLAFGEAEPVFTFPSVWMPLAFGEAEPVFTSEKEAKNLFEIVFSQYNSLIAQFECEKLVFPFNVGNITPQLLEQIKWWAHGWWLVWMRCRIISNWKTHTLIWTRLWHHCLK
ncbi:MAG: hypothetical protein B6I36_07835 [Desulfobacteraceae bacterium 4572_35.1]|nr:MAG: hypothetical protein B6I36_07835 [Desulfobacteraceae bacterium 4572_35.1]